jgi:endonuclease I
MTKKAENVILAFWNSHQQERQYWHRDGVAAALREVINQLQQSSATHPAFISCPDLLELCEELEGK